MHMFGSFLIGGMLDTWKIRSWDLNVYVARKTFVSVTECLSFESRDRHNMKMHPFLFREVFKIAKRMLVALLTGMNRF